MRKQYKQVDFTKSVYDSLQCLLRFTLAVLLYNKEPWYFNVEMRMIIMA